MQDLVRSLPSIEQPNTNTKDSLPGDRVRPCRILWLISHPWVVRSPGRHEPDLEPKETTSPLPETLQDLEGIDIPDEVEAI